MSVIEMSGRIKRLDGMASVGRLTRSCAKSCIRTALPPMQVLQYAPKTVISRHGPTWGPIRT